MRRSHHFFFSMKSVRFVFMGSLLAGFVLASSCATIGFTIPIGVRVEAPPAAVEAPVSAVELSAESLVRQVVIRRDQWGVPHILGENMPAAVFGYTYAQAEDHILGITQTVLHAKGELSQYFGPSFIESDLFMRRYHIYDYGASRFDTLPPEIQEMFAAGALGLNFYIEEHREQLPPWVQPVDAKDMLAHSRAGLLRFAFNRGRIIERIQRANPGDRIAAAGPDEIDQDMFGSNMWALAPERTKSGKAILMGNPHQAWNQVFYEGQVTVPGEYNVYGATFIGGMIPTIAFNENLGWSHTVNYPDIEDVYELKLDPERPDHYLFDGESIPLQKFEVVLKVMDGEGVREESHTFWECEIGPVIHRTDDRVWVIKSAALTELRPAEQWYRMGKASNLDEFDDALAMNATPMFNVCYADREGNILFHWMARLPVRPEGQDGVDPVPASGASDVWQTVHPASDMPRLLNPPGGYVQNSNDPPWLTTLHQKIEPKDFPIYMPRERLGLRTQHSLELIHDRGKFSLEDVVELKHSPKMLLADRMRDDLVAAVNGSNGNAEANAALSQAGELLAEWDGTVRRDSIGSVLFSIWWDEYRKLVTDPWRVPWSPDDPVATPRGLADPAKGVEALVNAIAICTERSGSIDVSWGEVHRIRRGDIDLPLAGGSGSLGCFRVISYANAEDGKRVATGGDSWVFAVEFGETPKAYSIVAYSQSERKGAPHHADQVPLFADNQMKRVSFTEEEIQANLDVAYRPGER